MTQWSLQCANWKQFLVRRILLQINSLQKTVYQLKSVSHGQGSNTDVGNFVRLVPTVPMSSTITERSYFYANKRLKIYTHAIAAQYVDVCGSLPLKHVALLHVGLYLERTDNVRDDDIALEFIVGVDN